MAFFTPVDIANRALQHCGLPRIVAFTDSSRQAKETNFAIDMIRRSELRRSIWTFATRRAVLRTNLTTAKPLLLGTYAAGTTYAGGDIIQDSTGYQWISLRASNTGNTPGAGGANPYWGPYYGPQVAQAWSNAIGYFPGDLVVLSSVIYICVLANTNNTPPNATYWHVVVGATGDTVAQIAPLGVNPPTGATTRNIYRLPANFIRVAPQDPKAAAVVRSGASAGMSYNDWEFEAGYLFTADASPIIFRFVADQTDVTVMDDLFCEVWAAHLALEVCTTLTQNVQKVQEIQTTYSRYLEIAKQVNSIELGSTESELSEGSAPQGQPAQRGQ